MRTLLFHCLLVVSLLVFSFLSHAQTDFYTVEQVPNPKTLGNGYVSNPDNIITAQDVAELNRLIAEIEDSTSAQVAVVILQSIGKANPKEFTTRLFNTWGIGQADVDNGLLIFAVMDQRRTEFETGYGLEGVLPDVVCYRIAMQQLVPEFKQGRYGLGLRKAVEQIKLNLEDPEAAAEISANPRLTVNPYMSTTPTGAKGIEKFKVVLLIYGILACLTCLATLIYIFNILRSREELYDKYMRLKKMYWFFPLALFPIPYVFVFFYRRRTLKSLRYQKRYSRETGALLRMLSEDEEDTYLEHGQITEEEVGSVDYDVWVDESGEEILILRYKKKWTRYTSCPECTYQTYYRSQTQTLQAATYSSSGIRLVIHTCKSCKFQQEKRETIPQKTQSSSSSGGGFSSGGGGSSFGGGSSGGGGAGASW